MANDYRNIDKFVRVKRKDNKNNQKSGYYLGEIYGRIEEYEVDEQDYYKLTLHIGKPYKIMQLDEETDTLSDLLENQEYRFPKEELARFIECIESMYSQYAHFTMLLMNTDIYIPGEKSLLSEQKTMKK